QRRAARRPRPRCPRQSLSGALQFQPLPLRRMNYSHFPSRRQFLRRAGFGLGSIALASLLKDDGLLAAPVKPPVVGPVSFDLLPKQPHFQPKAKAMISLYMMGGPSQMDLFDPKPMLSKYDGQVFPGEIKYDNLAE